MRQVGRVPWTTLAAALVLADRAVAYGPTVGTDWHLHLDRAVLLPFAGRPAASSR